ncbi:FAD-binding protein [Amycolatopsis kentuckyensis]|uniref:FAD-binding protein n=1 Tax=Amycolatopsis kentuckyensis TaxID=218823 RepID=UPI0035685992
MLVSQPGDAAYERATRVFNLIAPVEPAAAAEVRTVDDVRAALAHARRAGLAVRVMATGHASATAGPMPGALLLRTLPDGPVELDLEARRVRIPAGTPWGDVVAVTAPHGLAAPHGSSPGVGAVGYLLRGGLSFYGRHTGLAANSVRAVELVTADGEHRRLDAETDPEAFWAVRGGGGGLGVVTAVEVDLFPAAKVVTGAAFWPAAHADRLFKQWREWTADAPDTVTTALRVMNLPDLPQIPEALRAGPVLGIDGVVLSPSAGDLPLARAQAGDLLGPLRAIAEPVFDTWHEGGPEDVPATHMDPADPAPVHGDHLLLGDLDDEGGRRFTRIIGERRGSPLVTTELRQLGGAFGRPDPAGGALSHLPAGFAYVAAGVPFGDVTIQSIVDTLATAREALTPWDTGLTTPTLVETPEQPQGILAPDTIAAVDRVRDRLDPDGLFRQDIARNSSNRT